MCSICKKKKPTTICAILLNGNFHANNGGNISGNNEFVILTGERGVCCHFPSAHTQAHKYFSVSVTKHTHIHTYATAANGHRRDRQRSDNDGNFGDDNRWRFFND